MGEVGCGCRMRRFFTDLGGRLWANVPCWRARLCGRGRLSDYGIRFVWYAGLLGPNSAFDVWGRTFQGFLAGWRTITKFIAKTRSCRCKWLSAAASATRRACPPGDVDFMQLSKIRGAANGKVETSRGRKSYKGARWECRRKRIFGRSESP
jgi:hypothetical protein